MLQNAAASEQSSARHSAPTFLPSARGPPCTDGIKCQKDAGETDCVRGAKVGVTQLVDVTGWLDGTRQLSAHACSMPYMQTTGRPGLLAAQIKQINTLSYWPFKGGQYRYIDQPGCALCRLACVECMGSGLHPHLLGFRAVALQPNTDTLWRKQQLAIAEVGIAVAVARISKTKSWIAPKLSSKPERCRLGYNVGCGGGRG